MQRDMNSVWVFVIVSLIAASVYVASSGPVISYCCHSDSPEFIEPCSIVYRPLHRLAPSLLCRYLFWWGVSDIEVFFLFSPGQTNHEMQQ